MKNENYKIQMIAIQALYEKYGFCPAPQQVTLLESDGEGSYILFRVNDHEYRCDNGMILNIEDGKKNDEVINEYFQMYFEALKGKNAMEYQSKQQTKRINELRFENRELKDANKQLKSERDEFIKSWLSVREKLDKMIRDLKK